MASSVLQSDTSLESTRWQYRPHLDGLRTVAVMLVIFFHSRLGWAGGGFIGVDVFFVLSGFLVSGLLLTEFNRSSGVGLLRFYARRVRRLLPASLVTLLVVAWVTSQVVAPLTASNLRSDFVSAALYVSNWNFVAQASDYFATELEQSPVLHFWSLSVEEQFYLFWPAVLVGLLVWGRKRRSRTAQWLPWVVAAIAAASFVLALVLSQDSVSRAYYGTDVRIYQLLAGATLAVVVTKRRLPSAPPLAWRVLAVAGGALLIIGSLGAVSLGPVQRGGVATIATLAIIAGLEQLPGQPLGTLLSRPGAIEIGRISYGMYLWHWPIALVVLDGWSIGPGLGVVLITVGATAVAWLSNKFIEWPIRSSRRLSEHHAAVIGTGLGASVVAAVLMWFVILPSSGSGFVVDTAAPELDQSVSSEVAEDEAAGDAAAATPAAEDPATTETRQAEPATTAPTPEALGINPLGLQLLDPAIAAEDTVDSVNCIERTIERCLVVDGDGPHMLVFGDSHGIVTLPAFVEMAEQRGLRLSASVLSACPWNDVRAERDGVVFQKCDRFRADTLARIVPEMSPDVIVLVSRTTYTRALFDQGDLLEPGEPGFDEAALAGIRRSLDVLQASGAEIYIVSWIPEAPGRIPECLSGAASADECDFTVAEATELETALVAEAAGRPGVAYIDIDLLACPALPTCNAVVDGIITRRDEHHLTATYARAIATPWYDLMAAESAVLP